jgi:hypothetical protein
MSLPRAPSRARCDYGRDTVAGYTLLRCDSAVLAARDAFPVSSIIRERWLPLTFRAGGRLERSVSLRGLTMIAQLFLTSNAPLVAIARRNVVHI